MARFLIEVEVDESYIENEVSVFENEKENIEETEGKSAEQWLEEEMGWVAQSGIHMINHTELSNADKGYITAEYLIDRLRDSIKERDAAYAVAREHNGINRTIYTNTAMQKSANVVLLEDILREKFSNEYKAIKEEIERSANADK